MINGPRKLAYVVCVAAILGTGMLIAAPGALADPSVHATIAGDKIEGTFASPSQPAYVVGLKFFAAQQANESGITCPGARSAPGGPGNAWECLFPHPITSTSFVITGSSPWPTGLNVLPFISTNLSTYVMFPELALTGNPAAGAAPEASSAQPAGNAPAVAPVSAAPEHGTASVIPKHTSRDWLWWTVFGVGLAVLIAGYTLRRQAGPALVETQVEQPALPPYEVGRREDASVAIDEGIVQGFVGMGKQDKPGTVSDDVGPPQVNPDVPITPYTPPSADELAGARQWGQDLAVERDKEDDSHWHLHHAQRTPNKGLQELYDKLEQVNALITQLEGPQGDSVVDHDWLENTWHEYSTIPLTSSDPLEQAYQWRDQVQGLIQLYQGKGGAQAVNLAINEQKNEMLVNTINMESDMAHGTAIASTGGALAKTQAGYHPEPGNRIPAKSAKGGKTGAGAAKGTGLAPEPETVRMTPEEQGIKPQGQGFAPEPETTKMTPEQQGVPVDTEAETVHDGAAGAETQTMDPKPTDVPDVETVTQEAGKVELTFKEFQKGGPNADPHGVKIYERWLREQPPEWWDKIADPATKEYLKSWLAR